VSKLNQYIQKKIAQPLVSGIVHTQPTVNNTHLWAISIIYKKEKKNNEPE